MYVTSRACAPAGKFSGPLVVSMRPIPASLVARATDITAKLPLAHGAPVHVGDPHAIRNRRFRPDFGDSVTVAPDEVPVFWACGVTPQAVAMEAKSELMITHAPGTPLIYMTLAE